MTRSGMVFAFSNPRSPELDDEYNEWYNNVHVRDALLLPGYVRARRFHRSVVQPVPSHAALPHRFLALYDVDVALMPAASALSPWVAEVSSCFIAPSSDPTSLDGAVFETVLDTGPPEEHPSRPATRAIVIAMTTSLSGGAVASLEAHERTLRASLALPGVLRACRLHFAPMAEQRFPDRTEHGPATAFTLYEIDDVGALRDLATALSARGTPSDHFVGPGEAPELRVVAFDQLFETTEPSPLPAGAQRPVVAR